MPGPDWGNTKFAVGFFAAALVFAIAADFFLRRSLPATIPVPAATAVRYEFPGNVFVPTYLQVGSRKKDAGNSDGGECLAIDIGWPEFLNPGVIVREGLCSKSGVRAAMGGILRRGHPDMLSPPPDSDAAAAGLLVQVLSWEDKPEYTEKPGESLRLEGLLRIRSNKGKNGIIITLENARRRK